MEARAFGVFRLWLATREHQTPQLYGKRPTIGGKPNSSSSSSLRYRVRALRISVLSLQLPSAGWVAGVYHPRGVFVPIYSAEYNE